MRNLLLGLALIALAACGQDDGSDTGGVLFPLLASALALLSALLIAKGAWAKSLGHPLYEGHPGQKRVEKALRESEAKFRSIVDTASEGFWMSGPDALTIFVNARMAEMLGYSVEEMIGQPLTAFMFEEDVHEHLEKLTQPPPWNIGAL